MLGGPDSAGDEDENSSRPRNTQFELFVGAWFAAGGVWVQDGEPDIRVRILDQELGVAAKRVRSRKKILQRVAEAADQIESRKDLGIVAVNVDSLLDELPNTDDQKLLGEQFDQAFPEYDVALRRLIERPAIRGLIALGMRLGVERQGSGRRIDMALFCKYRAFTASDAESEAMNQFWKRFDQTQAERLLRF